MSNAEPLAFRGGTAGALAPFLLFLTGVAWLGLSGAPDERGFWPILVAALTLGLVLVRNRAAFADAVIGGMSRRIVMVMVLAWMLAGILGTLLGATGLVDALTWLARSADVSGAGFAVAAFLICGAVAVATGTSLGTILVCAPLLYPAGGALGAEPAVLLGAILGGATFGDNVSPVSDTTIASAMTQNAEMGRVVRSRMRYALPAAAAAMLAALVLGSSGTPAAAAAAAGNPAALPKLVVPAMVIALLLRGRQLLEGLLFGILATAVLGLGLGLLEPSQLLYIDAERFGARGLVVEGIDRAVGVSVFTLLLMGLVGALEASHLLARLVDAVGRRMHTPRGAEFGLFATISAAVLLTTHSVVAILVTGDFARSVGERFGIDRYRRSNLLDVTVCTYPFLLPYFIPTILIASTTQGAEAFGMPRLSALTAGMWNFYAWGLLTMLIAAIVTGWGREPDVR
jgi:Na+/H+ antiporter NhaC